VEISSLLSESLWLFALVFGPSLFDAIVGLHYGLLRLPHMLPVQVQMVQIQMKLQGLLEISQPCKIMRDWHYIDVGQKLGLNFGKSILVTLGRVTQR
jgi:hypothetical protein